MDANWLNDDDTIQGFEWRNGTDVVTYGIHIWSKPFIFENSHNEKVSFLFNSSYNIPYVQYCCSFCLIFNEYLGRITVGT